MIVSQLIWGTKAMLSLSFLGRTTTGDDAFDVGISDLLVTIGPDGPVLVAVSRMDGGIVSYSLAESTVPTIETIQAFESDLHTGNGPTLVAFGDDVLGVGLGTAEAITWGFTTINGLAAPDIGTIGSGEWTHVSAITGSRIVVAAEDAATFSVFELATDGGWDLVRNRSDRSDTFARDIGALEAVTVDGTDFVVTASASETGISTYEITNTNILGRDHIDASDGVGLMIPTDLATVVLDGETYLLVASAPTTFGAGAITVMSMSGFGQLTPTDHIMDTLDSRFAQVQSISVIEHGAIAFVAAGGGDDGISLLALLPGGRLVHLGALPDSVESGLDDVTEIETSIIGSTLHVYVASGADYGITTLTADLSSFGIGQIADAAGGVLTGTSGDDILMDGTGADRLSGGAGADLYVLGFDDSTDFIDGFDVNEDTIDLSTWTQLYDVNALTLSTTSDGATIEWRGETLVLTSSNGQSIDLDALRSAIKIDINRSFYAPQVALVGSNNAETLEGGWGIDTLDGRGGDDSIFGGSGDDILSGGSGNDFIDGGAGTDTLLFDYARADLVDFAEADGLLTLAWGAEIDTVSGVELFQFTDAILTLAELSSLFGPVLVTGTQGHDVLTAGPSPSILMGYNGNDTLNGGAADDTLRGDDGDDIINGFQGNDVVYAGAGDDDIRTHSGDDLVYGGDGVDFIRGGPDFDTLYGEEGDDILRGQRHNDTLFGGNGNDNLVSGGGNDVVWGQSGDDFLKGGTYHDFLDGGWGNDTIYANRGDDTLVGQRGDDHLRGGGGEDIIVGGDGDDRLFGGTGSDVFTFFDDHGTDLIGDFSMSDDTIFLSESLVGALTDAVQVVNTYVSMTAQGALFDFGGGNSILLEGVMDISGLAGTLDLS